MVTPCKQISPLVCVILLAVISAVVPVVSPLPGILGADGSMASQVLDPQLRPDFPTFAEYVVLFNKGYQSGTDEYAKREKIYQGWKDYWMKKYESGELTFKVGATQRSDWNQQERDNAKPESHEEPLGQEDHIQLMQSLSQSPGNPIAMDWRSKGVITSIKDQGSCGSCWTFATAAYGESRLIMKGKANQNIDLSEQYLLSCTPQCSCSGGYLEYVFEEAANGVPTEMEYPYDPRGVVSPFICWTGSKEFFGYFPNKGYDLSTAELETLLQAGPLAISISATNWEDYRGGIFRCQPYDKINHAVLLVGYDQNTWIIKNQWGKKWGEDGFIRITKDRMYNCKIGASAFWMAESSLQQALWVFTLFILTFMQL